VGVAIASKWPIVDFNSVYYNSHDYNPKNIGKNDLLGEVLYDTQTDNFPGSRGLKHVVKSRCILSVVVQTEAGFVKVMTTHYTVSDLCTETFQMFDMSQLITSLVKHSQDLPTIFSADLNVRAQSYSVTLLKEVLSCHTGGLTDTLSNTHVAKKKDFPAGLAIDHVFSKNLNHKTTSTVEVSFSEHKALISEFTL
jgi:endonuclease/exonuclease/phosphatase (EEP) superfamily protein YafD